MSLRLALAAQGSEVSFSLPVTLLLMAVGGAIGALVPGFIEWCREAARPRAAPPEMPEAPRDPRE